MLYTEKEKNEIERVRKVFEKHIQQMTGYDLVWSDKVGQNIILRFMPLPYQFCLNWQYGYFHQEVEEKKNENPQIAEPYGLL